MAATFQPHSRGHQGKISKYRARSTVKPILKKLHSNHSEKNSLDLDRGWEEQQAPQVIDYSSYDNDASGDALFGYGTSSSSQLPTFTSGRGTRDVSFDLSSVDLTKAATNITTTATGNSNSASATSASTSSSTSATTTAASSSNVTSAGISSPKFPYHHARSTSGASQFSVATSNSGRNGSFVHPFQQTPRTSSPPLLSYAASLASVENSNAQRDYSPTTITETEDDLLDSLGPPIPTANSAAARVYQGTSSTQAHTGIRRPSLAGSQRASSLSDAPLTRTTTGRTGSASVLRLVTAATNTSIDAASASNHGRSTDTSLHHFTTITPSVTVVDDSPLSMTDSATFGITPQMPAAKSSSTHPMSPLRSSLDMNNFRIRSRSDVDTATRQEHVRAARRKFEQKEKAKEDKYAREQVRKRERSDTREAHRLDKAQSRNRGTHDARNSSSTDPRPSFTRKSTGHSRFDTQDEVTTPVAEPIFATRVYDDMEAGQSPSARADDVHFESSKRSKTATKKKTTGTWTAFVLWFRTRLLKLGRR